MRDEVIFVCLFVCFVFRLIRKGLPFTVSYAASIVIFNIPSIDNKAIDYTNINKIHDCKCNDQLIANYHFRWPNKIRLLLRAPTPFSCPELSCLMFFFLFFFLFVFCVCILQSQILSSTAEHAPRLLDQTHVKLSLFVSMFSAKCVPKHGILD